MAQQYNLTAILIAGNPINLLDGPTAIGTANSQQFCTQNDKNVDIECDGVYTVATVDLQRSDDGGVTWVAVTGQTGIDLFANKTTVLYVPCGLPHRLALKTFTGTSITVKGFVAS
jgi:hypothetical protein